MNATPAGLIPRKRREVPLDKKSAVKQATAILMEGLSVKPNLSSYWYTNHSRSNPFLSSWRCELRLSNEQHADAHNYTHTAVSIWEGSTS